MPPYIFAHNLKLTIMVQKIVVSLSAHELSHQCLIVDHIVGAALPKPGIFERTNYKWTHCLLLTCEYELSDSR